MHTHMFWQHRIRCWRLSNRQAIISLSPIENNLAPSQPTIGFNFLYCQLNLKSVGFMTMPTDDTTCTSIMEKEKREVQQKITHLQHLSWQAASGMTQRGGGGNKQKRRKLTQKKWLFLCVEGKEERSVYNDNQRSLTGKGDICAQKDEYDLR